MTETVLRLLKKFPQGSLVLMLLSALSIILAFGREAVIAYYFGATKELDVFLVALSLPQFIATQAGMITVAVLLPSYVRQVKKDAYSDEAKHLVVCWTRWFLLFIGLLTVFCLLWPQFIIAVIGHGLAPEAKADAAHWLRLLTPYLFILSAVAPLRTVLEAHRAFTIPYLTGSLISISLILSTATLYERIGVGSLVMGYSIGALAALIFHRIRTITWQPKVLIGAESCRIQDLPLKATGAMLVVSTTGQLTPLIDRAFASSLGNGAVAAYNYANVLVSVPTVLISSAVATALFPQLAEFCVEGRMRESFRLAFRWALALSGLMLLFAFVLIWLREDIVKIVFMRGQFGENALAMTSVVLLPLPILMVANTSSTLANRLLLSLSMSSQLAFVAVGVVVVKFLATWYLSMRFGLVGIAMATVIVAVTATIIRFWIAHRVTSIP